MLYIDFKFTITPDGLEFEDKAPDNIQMDQITQRVGWQEGDKFTLETTGDGRLKFVFDSQNQRRL